MANPTLAEYRSSLQSKGYGTDTATPQLDAINQVRRELLASRRWRFLEKTATLTATAGTASVSLSTVTDLGQLDTVRIAFGTEYDDLVYRAPEELRRKLHLNRDVGVPDAWTRYAGSLLLYPTPQYAYSVVVDYLMSPSDLAADGDVDVIPRAHMDVVTWGAIKQMAFRERDWNARALADAEYSQRLRDMTAADAIEQRQTSGRVGHWRGWDYA